MLGEKIKDLEAKIVEFFYLVQDMLKKSMDGILNGEKKNFSEVIKQKEPMANSLEIEIDGMCANLIAVYAPKAKELREIITILKMNNDLERIGDHAVNIANVGENIDSDYVVKEFLELRELWENVDRMLQKSLKAFINEDTSIAREVCENDDVIDRGADSILLKAVKKMVDAPLEIEDSLKALKIAGNLERVGDLATNICEDVFFMVEGKVIKHHADEQKRNMT